MKMKAKKRLDYRGRRTAESTDWANAIASALAVWSAP